MDEHELSGVATMADVESRNDGDGHGRYGNGHGNGLANLANVATAARESILATANHGCSTTTASDETGN